MNGNRWINAEVKNYFDTNQCSFYQGTTYHATEPIVMIWEAESPNTGDDMTLFSRYTNDENVRAQSPRFKFTIRRCRTTTDSLSSADWLKNGEFRTFLNAKRHRR